MKTGSCGRRLSAILALTLIGIAAGGEPPPRSVSKEFEYSFQPPEGWKPINGLPKSFTGFTAPKEKEFAANFRISVQVNQTALDDKKVFEGVRRQYAKSGKVIETLRTALGGQPAYSWRARIHVAKYPEIENRQVYCFYNKRAYLLTFTILPTLKKKYDPICDKIIASFQFEK